MFSQISITGRHPIDYIMDFTVFRLRKEQVEVYYAENTGHDEQGNEAIRL